MKKRFLTVFFLFIFILSAFSDNIRGEVSSLITINSEKSVTNFKLFDLTGISAVQNPFLEGLDLTLTIPEELMKYRDSFMINIYYRLDNNPDELLKVYKGSNLLSTTIPVSRKMFISIPLTGISNTDSIPGSIICPAVDISELPLLLSITPVMKGIPSSVLTSVFELEILPVISNKGILNLDITSPASDEKYTILLDGKKITNDREFILTTGIHQIKVVSDSYKEISRSFVIERGESNKISISLESLLPTVVFEAPHGAEIFLDGKKLEYISGNGIQIEPGEHVVRIELSDYFLSRKFTVLAEKNYKVSLFLDILVQDN
ncbi:MAG: hypothetical protein KAR21_07065 [Spirochaetales bacterium]|nr:hypothetical protein [Spirochaetales bacterium]